MRASRCLTVARWATAVVGASTAYSQTAVPVSGHYPPGQSGIRGASAPQPGFTYTNFSRFFTNRAVVDADGRSVSAVNELRYANISMVSWTTRWTLLGMRYGALAGIPFATGNLRGTAENPGSADFALGDVLLTPVSLYGERRALDYQFQFTVWSASGRYTAQSPRNRGTGFWALVYSLGTVYYPGGVRDAWSISAVARIEQNFDQEESGVSPGDDIVVDWGFGRVVELLGHPIDAGVSGFGTWQLTAQTGGESGSAMRRYRYLGAGPEASASLSDHVALRIRAHWEFGVRNAVRGDNLWLIVSCGW